MPIFTRCKANLTFRKPRERKSRRTTNLGVDVRNLAVSCLSGTSLVVMQNVIIVFHG